MANNNYIGGVTAPFQNYIFHFLPGIPVFVGLCIVLWNLGFEINWGRVHITRAAWTQQRIGNCATLLVNPIFKEGHMSEPKSKTEQDSTVIERIIGTHHWKTTIKDDKDKVEGIGRTPEEAEKRASQRWKEEKSK